MPPLTLHERIDNWAEDLSLDVENRIVRNVALAGTVSRNGYRYSEEALTEAARLYENRPVFLDHAAHRQRPADRSTRDLVGSVVQAHYSQGRIRGDIRVLDTESGETFLKLVESETPGVGMSHVVLAQRAADGKTVDKIVEVVSVDVVINPATTSTFREATEPVDDRLLPLEQERDELLEQNRLLKRQLDDVHVREQVQRMLSESGLPLDTVSDCFREQLVQAGSPAIRQRLIDDRLHLLTEARRTGRVSSHERTPLERRTLSNDEFLRAFRRTV